MRLLWLLILFCLCVSVGGEEYWTTLTINQMHDFLVKTNKIKAPEGVQITSAVYSIPSIKWVEKTYFACLKAFLETNNLTFYSNPQNNCVRYSNYAVTVGYLRHYHYFEGPQNTSLAIGIVDFFQTKKEGHSVNFFVATDTNKVIKIYYFEPKIQTPIDSKTIIDKWKAIRL